MHRICTKCKLEKSIDQFYKCKGKVGSWCKECSIKNAHEHYVKYKQEYQPRSKQYRLFFVEAINKFKMKYKCALCCGIYHPICMEFHHVNNDKDFIVSALCARKNKGLLVKEINKCSLVCVNCHRLIHHCKLKLDLVLCKITLEELDKLLQDIKTANGYILSRKRKQSYINPKRFCICGKNKDIQAIHCKECAQKNMRKVKDRPTQEELLELLQSHSFCAVGRKYGVSDNTIRKWLK